MDDPPLVAMLLRGVREAQSMILVAILLGLDLPSLIASLDRYPAPWVGWAWYAALAAVAVADIAIGVRNRFWGRAAWPAGLFVLCVSIGAAASLDPAALLTPAHWTFGVVGWFGMLIFAGRPTRHVVVFILLHVVATAVLLAARGVLPGSLVSFLTITVGVSSFQFALITATLVLQGMAGSATGVAIAQAEAVTKESVARQVHADREARYGALRETALPLLRGIAEGRLSPSDREVQRRAAVEAARMRRLFGEQGDQATLLATEVAALVDLVERRGVRVRYAARPVEVEPPPEVRRSLVEAVSGVLLVTARTARVTVGGTGSDVTVSVVTDGDVGESRQYPPSPQVQTSTVVDDGRTWVEARWSVP